MTAATLLVFHGYTMNGRFGASVARVLAPLADRVRVMAPDAPLACSEEAVARFYEGTGLTRHAGPHLTWWRANADNSVYEGWDATLALVREVFREHAPVGLLGFSQGAMVASLCAALAANGELPSVRFAILVAGRAPRAQAFRTLLSRAIDVPSLHVWGERDPFSSEGAPELMQHFAERGREKHVWAGAHSFPTSGSAADALRAFVAARLDTEE